MLSWSPREWVGVRQCDAPGCENESRPDHRLVTRPTVGPALDIPLCLYFCDEHRDVESLLDRYLELIGAAGRHQEVKRSWQYWADAKAARLPAGGGRAAGGG